MTSKLTALKYNFPPTSIPYFKGVFPETSLYRPAQACRFSSWFWGEARVLKFEVHEKFLSLGFTVPLFFFFPAPCLMHHASPHPMQRKPGVLTTGSPGKSPLLLYFKTGCQVDKDLDFEAWQPGLKFQLCCFPAVWPWASFLTSLMANFFLFQRGWW